MKLIKNALRNRLYIETLDALMSIRLLGEQYILSTEGSTLDSEGKTAEGKLKAAEDKLVQAALDDWENAKLRNPNQARFGNLNAKKKFKETLTEIPAASKPNPGDDSGAPGDDSGDNANGRVMGFDEAADAAAANQPEPILDLPADAAVDDTADVGPFQVPTNHTSTLLCPVIDHKELKKAGKFAFKFPEGWETATFRGPYKGRDVAFKGSFDFYFQAFKRKISMHLDADQYGVSKSWVVYKKNNNKK